MDWVRVIFILILIGPGWDMKGGAAADNLPRRVALVIGEGDYLSVPQLPNPPSDAEQIGAALRNVGFTKVTVAKNLNHVQFLRALRDFSSEAIDADWAVVYYAGHGIEVRGKNYMIPTDAELAVDTDVEFEAISMEAILASVAGATKLRLVILDACRDNPFLGKMRRSMATRSLARGLARVDPQGDLFIVYSAQAGATALDGPDGQSPFVKALLKNIGTPGLEINLLFRRVRADVMQDTRAEQEPAFEGSLPSEELYFREAETTGANIAHVQPTPEPTSALKAAQVSVPRAAVPQAIKPVVHSERQPVSVDASVPPASQPKPEPTPTSASPAKAVTVANLEEKPGASEVEQRPIAAAIQTELLRLGCEPGAPNGSWTKVSRTALSKAGERLHASFDLDRPNNATLQELQRQSQEVCKPAADRTIHRRVAVPETERLRTVAEKRHPTVARRHVAAALGPVVVLPRYAREIQQRPLRPRPVAEARPRAIPGSSGCFVFNGQHAC